jgi:hypothetical protein
MPAVRLGSALGIATLVVAAGCSSPAGTTEASLPWPIDPDANVAPERMTVDPRDPSAGELVDVTYPEGWDRGVLYALDRQVGDGWTREFMLLSGEQPIWFEPGDNDIAVAAVGVSGRGPDRVRVPEVVEAGTWRLCTANAVENVCALLEIRAP